MLESRALVEGKVDTKQSKEQPEQYLGQGGSSQGSLGQISSPYLRKANKNTGLWKKWWKPIRRAKENNVAKSAHEVIREKQHC